MIYYIKLLLNMNKESMKTTNKGLDGPMKIYIEALCSYDKLACKKNILFSYNK